MPTLCNSVLMHFSGAKWRTATHLVRIGDMLFNTKANSLCRSREPQEGHSASHLGGLPKALNNPVKPQIGHSFSDVPLALLITSLSISKFTLGPRILPNRRTALYPNATRR